MFGFFNSKKKKALEEQRYRANFFFKMCKDELHNYVLDLRGKEDPPTIEECTRAAINAKIIYEMFKNVPEIAPEARVMGVSLAGQTIDLIVEERKTSEMDAGKALFEVIGNEIELLKNGQASERILGSVSSAFVMSCLTGFDEVVA